MHAPERRPRVPLIAQLLLATVAGAITGKIFGSRAAALGDAALIFVDVLKLLATPLVFVAIVDTFVTTRLPLKRALVLLPVSALNAVVAAAIAIGLAHALPLGRFVDLARLRALAPAPSASRHLPSLNLMWVIAAALVVGLLLRAAAKTTAAQQIGRAVHQALRGLMHLVGVVVRVVPFAVFGVMAKVVGGSGLKLFPLLAIFVLLVALGMAIHILIWYALMLKVVARISPNRFFRFAGEPLLTALGVGSSLATLPVTLRTLEQMEVSPESARLAAVVGTNLNHDGIVLYEAAAALFVAQVYGVTLALAAQLRVVGLAVLAAVGIAGVPEAGLVTLSLVIGGVGLPLAAVPLLLPVDWMLGRLRAMTNVASDMTVANVLDRFR
ncbi:MAG TPA: cation:dicarboxylase symporter family transporter [Polyangia bacterium]|nr:cation:dicarboxylase symporter family transporter [Polyangia bacterium]